jgi:N-methylhydantoinase B
MEAAGGGGYGHPQERDRRLILEDVLDGYVSLRSAKEDYGIEFAPEEMAHIEKVLAFQNFGSE